MAERQYIGARYVPVFADPIEWQNNRSYEPLTIVTYNGNSYTSRKTVPAGVAPTDSTYWASTGIYNAQVEAYREEVQELKETVDEMSPIVNDTVFASSFGAVPDGVTDCTTELQAAIDASYGKTLILDAGTYVVSKNTALNFARHDEPCLYVAGDNIEILGRNTVLKCNTHAQGILEINNSNNVKIRNIRFSGYGSFPAIDPNSGRCEKGVTGQGYYHADFDFGSNSKNNSLNTSNWTGFGTDSSHVWGTFGGGYIANNGSGVILYGNSNDVLFEDCESYGFNFAGFRCGLRDTGYPKTNLNNVKFIRCVAHDCYACGFSFDGCEGIVAWGCEAYRIGHTSALVDDPEDYAFSVNDPGYGFTCTAGIYSSGEYGTNNVKILQCYSHDNVRNGFDIHWANTITFDGCVSRRCVGAGIALNGSPNLWTSVFDSYVHDVIVQNMVIEKCGVKSYALSFAQTNRANEGQPEPVRSNCNCKLINTLIKDCYAGVENGYGCIAIYRFGGIEINGLCVKKPTVLANNQQSNALINAGHSMKIKNCYFEPFDTTLFALTNTASDRSVYEDIIFLNADSEKMLEVTAGVTVRNCTNVF